MMIFPAPQPILATRLAGAGLTQGSAAEGGEIKGGEILGGEADPALALGASDPKAAKGASFLEQLLASETAGNVAKSPEKGSGEAAAHTLAQAQSPLSEQLSEPLSEPLTSDAKPPLGGLDPFILADRLLVPGSQSEASAPDRVPSGKSLPQAGGPLPLTGPIDAGDAPTLREPLARTAPGGEEGAQLATPLSGPEASPARSEKPAERPEAVDARPTARKALKDQATSASPVEGEPAPGIAVAGDAGDAGKAGDASAEDRTAFGLVSGALPLEQVTASATLRAQASLAKGAAPTLPPRSPKDLPGSKGAAPEVTAPLARGVEAAQALPQGPLAAPGTGEEPPASAPPSAPANASLPSAASAPSTPAASIGASPVTQTSPASAPAPNAATGSPGAALPNTDILEQVAQQVAEAREAGRSLRPELSVRHSEFGTVAMRIEPGAGASGDWRATLSARDPGFVPAVQAAIADRGVLAASESGLLQSGLSQNGQSQNGASVRFQDFGPQSGSSASNAQSSAGFGSASGGGSEARYGSSTGGSQGPAQPYLGEEGDGGSASTAANSGEAGSDGAGDARGGALFA